jgi:hypothetical protein
MSLATPLAAFIRVPLEWYSSTTHAAFEDESHVMIRRKYSHPTEQHSQRHFCGFCGTPLSFWSEMPRSEAKYIQITLGSLSNEDLRGLEEMGLVPDLDEPEQNTDIPKTPEDIVTGTSEVPWISSMMKGTRLGKMRRAHALGHSSDGKVAVDWEIVEWAGDGGSVQEPVDTVDPEINNDTTISAKRKLQELDDAGATA